MGASSRLPERSTIPTGRFDEGKHRKPNEHGSDFGFEERAWDTQDVPLEGIERIEVIRGPGGTIWGANAVNGVINIIMKKPGDTLGTTLVGGGGTQAQGFGAVQYGGKIKEDTSYRIFAKYLNNNHFPNLHGQNGHDGWHLLHDGFRVDADLSDRDSLTTEGDLYTGSEGAVIVHSVLSPPDNLEVQRLAKLSGGNVLTRWNHIFSNRSDTTVKFYFDRYARSGPESREARDTIDFEFQNHLKIGKSPGPRVGTRISTQRGSNRRNHRPGFCPGQLVRPFFQLVCAGPNNAETQSSRPVYWDEAGERLFHRARPSAKRALNLDSDSAPHSLGSSIAGHQHSDSARRGLECGAGGAARAGRSCSAGKPGRKLRACYLLRVGVQDAAECPAVFRPRRIL